MTDKDILKIEEIADELALNPQTIRNWIKSGHLRATRAGRAYRVKRSDLDETLGMQAAKTPSLGLKRDVWDPETIGTLSRRDDATSEHSIWDGTGNLTLPQRSIWHGTAELTPAHKRK
jgi:excisionase family DNA binding protein